MSTTKPDKLKSILRKRSAAEPAPPKNQPQPNPEPPTQPATSANENPQKPSPLPEILSRLPQAPNPSSELPSSPITLTQTTEGLSEPTAEADPAISAIPVDEPEGPWPGGAALGSVGDVVTADEFWQRFQFVFEVAQGASPQWAGVQLETVAIQAHEHDAARAAADEVYNLAVKYPDMLGWMVARGDDRWRALGTIGFFFWLKLKTVKAEILAKRAGPAESDREAA